MPQSGGSVEASLGPDRGEILRIGNRGERVGVVVNDQGGMGLAQVVPEIGTGELEHPARQPAPHRMRKTEQLGEACNHRIEHDRGSESHDPAHQEPVPDGDQRCQSSERVSHHGVERTVLPADRRNGICRFKHIGVASRIDAVRREIIGHHAETGLNQRSDLRR